jgi:hypothetical protein
LKKRNRVLKESAKADFGIVDAVSTAEEPRPSFPQANIFAATIAKSHLRGTEEKRLMTARESGKVGFAAFDADSTVILLDQVTEGNEDLPNAPNLSLRCSIPEEIRI